MNTVLLIAMLILTASHGWASDAHPCGNKPQQPGEQSVLILPGAQNQPPPEVLLRGIQDIGDEKETTLDENPKKNSIVALAGTEECHLDEMAMTQPKNRLPSVDARDKIFLCAGMADSFLKGFDQLDKDLLFERGGYMSLEQYLARYPNLPESPKKNLWKLVREFKAIQATASP